jgi:phenylacetate-CoA ligase
MVIVRGVNVFPTQIEEQVFKVKELSPHYQLVLTRSGRMDELEVLVEVADRQGASDVKEKASAELAHHIKSTIGVTARITVADPGGVARSEGKAKRVVDKRGQT